MTDDKQNNKVLVLGAGIVGICNALALREKGFEVTLIDKNEPSDATSYGNAGVISPWACIPQSMPGLWKKVPKWLLDPSGPLSIRWSYLPRMAPWLVEFLKSGHPKRLPAISDAMLTLNRPNLDLYKQLLQGTGEEGLIKDCYYLYVSRNLSGINLTSLEWKLREERGVPFEQISGNEARDLEPDLSPDVQSAAIIKSQGRTLNPGRLGKVLAAKAMGLGVSFLKAEITKVTPNEPDGYDVLPGAQELIALEVGIRDNNKQNFLSKELERLEEKYDYTIIDTPPTLNQLTLEGLSCSSGTLIPLQCEYYSLEGVIGLMKTIQTLSEKSMSSNRVIGIVRTMVDMRNNLAKEVSDELEKHFTNLIFNTLIPRNVKLAEAPSHGVSGIKYMPNSYGAKAYLALAGELIRRVEYD